MHRRKTWQPTPVFLPGESQGRGSLVASVYGVAQSWTQLKRLSSSSKTLQKHSVQFSRSVMSDSVQPHRRQPTRLPCPWDSPGKNTGVGCHVFLRCMKVKSQREAAQSCPTLRDPMDCSPPGSPIPGILQARTLEWDVSPYSDFEICGT